MNWLSNFVRPKIQAIMGATTKSEVPENLWTKCPRCENMLFQKDLIKNLNVCHHCDHHLRLDIKTRLKNLFDNEDYKTLPFPEVPLDPLKFKDTKRYTDRLKDYRLKTGEQDNVIVAYGKIEGVHTVVAAFNFEFMGGSMGLAAGKAIVNGAELAVKTRSPFIVIPASGGARMQEGILSLMQMPRTTIAVQMVKESGLPYLTLLTDPTTGGVTASFAMLGDIAIAEPGAIIGFAGARVIQETIRQTLPEGFQKSEYLLAHGMIDLVTHRHQLKDKIGKILSMIHRA